MSTLEHPRLEPRASNVPDRSPALIIISTIFLAVTTAFFTTRFIFRWRTKQRGWDDLMAGLAYLTLVIQTSFGYTAAHYGFGKHRSDILTTFTKAMCYFYLYQILYKMLGGFTKLNFCFLYLRIFKFKNFQRLVIVNAVIIGLGSLAFTVGTVFQCVPVKRNWDRRVDGFCISNMAFWYSHAAFNTFMDIVVYLLPIPLIRTLHMASRTKAGLIAIFALGAFTIAASIVRMLMLRASANSTQDPTWGSTTALIWTEIEANTSVICCCLPALRTLFVQAWRRLLLGKAAGPETPTNSQEQPLTKRSGQAGWRLEEQSTRPTRSRFLGNFTEAKFSPPASSTENLKRNPSKPNHAWLQGFKRASPETSEEEQLARVEQGEGEGVFGSTAPRLDLGQIYKTMDVHVESDVKTPYRYDSAKQEQNLGLKDVLNER